MAGNMKDDENNQEGKEFRSVQKWVNEEEKKSDKRKRSKNKIKVGGKMNPSDLISCDWNDVMNFSMWDECDVVKRSEKWEKKFMVWESGKNRPETTKVSFSPNI